MSEPGRCVVCGELYSNEKGDGCCGECSPICWQCGGPTYFYHRDYTGGDQERFCECYLCGEHGHIVSSAEQRKKAVSWAQMSVFDGIFSSKDAIEEMRSVCEGAASGPWVFEGTTVRGPRDDGWWFSTRSANDAQFIADVRTWFPAVLDYIERVNSLMQQAVLSCDGVVDGEWLDSMKRLVRG